MLPTAQILIWQQLFTLLSDLPSESTPELKTSIRQAIELFEREIIPQDLDSLPDPIAGKMRSYVTESHRLLRLISMDALFIATTRDPTTIDLRSQAYRHKLDLLLQYCQAVIDNA